MNSSHKSKENLMNGKMIWCIILKFSKDLPIILKLSDSPTVNCAIYCGAVWQFQNDRQIFRQFSYHLTLIFNSLFKPVSLMKKIRVHHHPIFFTVVNEIYTGVTLLWIWCIIFKAPGSSTVKYGAAWQLQNGIWNCLLIWCFFFFCKQISSI